MVGVLLLSVVAGLNPVLYRGYRHWWFGYVTRVLSCFMAVACFVTRPQEKLLDLFPIMIFSNLIVTVVNSLIEIWATKRRALPRETYGLFLGIVLGIGLFGLSLALRILFLHSN